MKKRPLAIACLLIGLGSCNFKVASKHVKTDIPSGIGILGGTPDSVSTKALDQSHDYSVLIDPTEAGVITQLSLTSIDLPFALKGGSYPGTGGTCGQSITGPCTIVLSFTPTDITNYSSSLTLSYLGGGVLKGLTLTLAANSVLGQCSSGPSELDDYVSAGANECNSIWENTSVTGGDVSLDKRTGLMWSRDAEAGDFISEVDGVNDGLMNWFEATGTLASGALCTNANHTNCNPDGESYCGHLNTIQYGGHDDWRLPGQKEVMQAYVNGASHNATVFDLAKIYWANTTESDSNIWGSVYRFGYTSNSDTRKNTGAYASAICVRSGATPLVAQLSVCSLPNEVDDFVSNAGDECDSDWTVEAVTGGNVSTDTRTGLMWSRQSAAGDITSELDGSQDGLINWFEASGTLASGTACTGADQTNCNPDGESFCGSLNTISYGGHSNWRLPGHKELIQAYINGGSHLSQVFSFSSFYWSIATKSDDSKLALVRRFGYGNGTSRSKDTSATRAICVRNTY